MHTFLVQQKPKFESVIEYLQGDLASLRTGRATPALVEDIPVNAYDSIMEIKGLSSITVPDAKTITIDPWDKALLQNMEKAIRDSGIGLSPVVDGDVIRIAMPMMTEDNRKSMVKIMKDKIEDARIKVRHVREELRDLIMKQEKDKDISEDEKFKILDELDKFTKEYTDQISDIAVSKEKEIMTV